MCLIFKNFKIEISKYKEHYNLAKNSKNLKESLGMKK